MLMSALVLILAALARSEAEPSPEAAPSPDGQEVEVVVPQPDRQLRCRIERASNSRIPARRICQTRAEREAERDAEQSAAGRALDPSNRRTGQTLNTSSYGNYARERWTRPVEAPR
jgi:hypothetical protein